LMILSVGSIPTSACSICVQISMESFTNLRQQHSL
jgi:hypothetical protein